MANKPIWQLIKEVVENGTTEKKLYGIKNPGTFVPGLKLPALSVFQDHD